MNEMTFSKALPIMCVLRCYEPVFLFVDSSLAPVPKAFVAI